MPDIAIHRTHHLGLKKARRIAWQWAEQVEAEFDMQCTVEEGKDEDLVRFERTGVTGSLRVTAEAFDLEARLGFLLGAFQKTIEAEIERNLDKLLGSAGAKPAAKQASPRKTR